MKRILLLFFCVLFSSATFAQLSIANLGTQYTIDFSSTVSGVSNGAYTGAGFQSSPTIGQLDSDAWAVTGWSNGSLSFGETQTTASTDYTRGSTSVAVGTGGFYAYTGTPASVSNPRFLIQPGGGDFAPGTLTLRIQNNSGQTIIGLNVAYLLYVRNDQARSSSFNFSYSSDDISYTNVSGLDYTSPAAIGVTTLELVDTRSTVITGLNIHDGEYFYIRWSSNDVAGTGSRDEFGLDDIKIL